MNTICIGEHCECVWHHCNQHVQQYNIAQEHVEKKKRQDTAVRVGAPIQLNLVRIRHDVRIMRSIVKNCTILFDLIITGGEMSEMIWICVFIVTKSLNLTHRETTRRRCGRKADKTSHPESPRCAIHLEMQWFASKRRMTRRIWQR